MDDLQNRCGALVFMLHDNLAVPFDEIAPIADRSRTIHVDGPTQQAVELEGASLT